MDYSYNEKFSKGDHLILELVNNHVFEGIYWDGGKNRIDLINTTQHNNPNNLGGIYSFYRSEISDIKLLKNTSTDIPISKAATGTVDTNDYVKMDLTAYHQLKEMCKEHLFMENADKRYYDAVKIIRESENVAVAALGIDNVGTSKLAILVLSTCQFVFIFDMLNLRSGYFYLEIKEILESKFICKIIHNSIPLRNYLLKKHKIYFNNVFDTASADLILQNYQQTTEIKLRNISQCLDFYLNIPQSILKDALEIPDKKWREYPLNVELKLLAAQLAVYLIPLKTEIKQILLQKVHHATENIYNSYYHLNDNEFFEQICINRIIENLNKFI